MYFTRYCVLALIVGVLTLQAIPPQINYQGYLTRTDGSPLDTVVTMTFGLYQFQSGGTAVWTQVQNPCTVRAGLFAVSLGPLGSDDPNFRPDTCFLGITVGGNSEMVPRSRILSVPFALMVGSLDGAEGGHVRGPVAFSGELWMDSLKCNYGIRFSDNTWQESAWDTTSLSDRIDAKADSAGNATREWVLAQGYGADGQQYADTSTWDATRAWTNTQLALKQDFGDTSAWDATRSWVQSQGYTSGAQAYPDTITWDATKAWVQSMGYLRGASNNAIWNGFVGGGDNHVAGGQYSTVGGGRMNRARGDFSVIAGGGGGAWVDSNSVTGTYSAVGGGRRHSVAGVASVVSGGTSNSVSGYTSNIGGGEQNSNGGAYSGILGGHSNTIAADADYSTIAGGTQNQISGSRSFAAGWLAQANHDGAFVWADGTGSSFATTAPNQFLIRATNGVGIGRDNPVEQLDVNGDVRADTFRTNMGIRFPDGTFQNTAPVIFTGQQYADTNTWDATRTWVQNQSYVRSWELELLQADTDTNSWDATKTWVQSMGYLRGTGNSVSPTSFVGGGSNNTANFNFGTISGGSGNAANGDYATVAGGFGNVTGPRAAVGGGQYNKAGGQYSVIAGGGGLVESDSNSASGQHSTITGGGRNVASGTCAIVSGFGNAAGGDAAVVGGGYWNVANNYCATVAGGYQNVAGNQYATVTGGQSNQATGYQATVGGGHGNTASNLYSVVSGGDNNTASGVRATIPGGFSNRANGAASFAAGFYACANHLASFVWGSSNSADSTASFADYSFTARSPGGARFYTQHGGMSTGVSLAAGGGAWDNLCDARQKRLHGDVNTSEILQKISALPLHRWSYKSQDESIQHIGPTAQDFYAAFGLGESDTTINTLDPDGIALAAIQELTKQIAELRAENAAQQRQIQSLLAKDEQTQLKMEK